MQAFQSVRFLGLAAVIATGFAVVALPGFAQTQQKFPSKPIRLVVPSSPGGPPDVLARVIGPKMSEAWGQPVVIENRTGAAGTLAGAMVAKAAPDGYTLMLAPVGFTTNAVMQTNLPYDPLKDFAGVTQLGFPVTVLIGAPALGMKSLKDLIALGKAQPGKVLFASAGAGSAAHLSGERVRLAAGIKVVHVGFKGQPEATLEVLAGRVHYAVVALGGVQALIKDGKLTGLGVTSPQRSPLLPDVPALGETLPAFKRPEATGGLLAPARTPRPVLDQINKEIARIFALPEVIERFHAISYFPLLSTPEEYDRIRRAQIESLSRLVREAGLLPK
jgi:tripartite-type tricarboxylate transporter receptor subunit TctC